MEKPVRSSIQNLSISYECSLAIGNSLNLSEMLQEVIHKMVRKTNAHRGIIWVKNEAQELQPVASAGINIKDVRAQGEIMDLRSVLDQIQKRHQFVLRYKDDKDFLQYCPVLTEKEESVLIVPVTNVAIIHLIYSSREIADETLANLLAGLSEKLSLAMEACIAHKNIINEVQERVEAEDELKKKTEQLISSEKELERLYGESEQARKSLLSILEDVRQKEEALKESNENFQQVVSNITTVVWKADIGEKGAFENTYISPVLDELLKLPAGTMKNDWDKYFGYIKPEYLEKVNNAFREAIKSPGKQIDCEYEVLKDNGQAAWFHSKGRCFEKKGKLYVFGSTEDITERVQAEEALRRAHENTKTILDKAPFGVFVIGRDRKIKWINDAALKMAGEENADIILGKHCGKYLCPAQQNECPILDKGQQVDNSERIFRGKDGKEIPIIKTVIEINMDGENVLLETFVNITERKKLEEQLQQAQKMEAIGVLAGGIAHDFNNLLTTIIANAQLVMMDVGKDDAIREEMEDIKKAGERAASLTRQILAFSRKQVIQPVTLDINEELRETEKMLRRLIGEDIEFLTVLDPELWKVQTDRTHINQVVVNLVVNARDAMPKGGKLTIETANVDLDRNYFHEHGIKDPPGSYMVISVSDTGIGMDKETQSHIFEPFFTTKERGSGTGLGLSTVYGIVKQSGGFIWVYSEPGQGATFKVYLPKAAEDEKPEKKGKTPADDFTGSETVLIVEDDDSLLNLARKILQLRGYTVLEAKNGEEGLKVSEEHKGPIHLLLTDVVMPKMSGGELAKRLQPMRPEMKVVYMSGYTDNAIVHHGVLAPGLNFIEKPFTLESLAGKVRETLDN